MSYREFHYEKQYAAPEVDGAFDAVNQGISNLFRNLRVQQDTKRKSADQFAYDLDKGAFENDTKLLTEIAKNVTARAKQELRTTGKLSLETENAMKDGSGLQQSGVNQMERAKQLTSDIKSKSDPYYNPEPDLNLVKWATHGEKNDINFYTRGERLAQAEQQLGGVDTFKLDKYRADYVKNIGAQSKKVESPLKSGASITRSNQATFWDDDKGIPGVTDKHAVRFLDSDRRVATYYDDLTSRNLDAEIKSMKSSGDQRTSWMKDLTNEEIKAELINDPKKNLINSENYGVRVRNQAKADLKEADRINSEVSYTALQDDKNNSGGRWKNVNILHDDAVNSFAQEAKSQSTGEMGTVTTSGPGGRFTQKSGRAVQIDTTNPVRTDINRGLTTKNNKGSLRLNMTGYQLMPVKKGDAPFSVKSIDDVKNIPLEYFDPNGKMGLQPELKIGLNGYTINEAGILNDIQDQMVDIATQINTAKNSGNKEDQAKLEDQEYRLNVLKDMIGDGDYDQQDLILAGNKAGVRKIQQSWIVPADNSDLATINNVTGGFNLRDKSYWSPDMLAWDEAYRARYEEAKKQGYGVKKEEPVSTAIASDGADTDKWKPSSTYKVGDSVYYFDKTAGLWKKK